MRKGGIHEVQRKERPIEARLATALAPALASFLFRECNSLRRTGSAVVREAKGIGTTTPKEYLSGKGGVNRVRG